MKTWFFVLSVSISWLLSFNIFECLQLSRYCCLGGSALPHVLQYSLLNFNSHSLSLSLSLWWLHSFVKMWTILSSSFSPLCLIIFFFSTKEICLCLICMFVFCGKIAMSISVVIWLVMRSSFCPELLIAILKGSLMFCKAVQMLFIFLIDVFICIF